MQLIERWKKIYSPTTVHSRTYCLRRVLRQIDKALGTDLEREATPPKAPEPRNQTISQAELDALLSIAPPHLKLFVSLMAGMALRFAEAKRAGPEHYDEDSKTLRIPTKGGKIRAFPVPDEIQRLFALAPAEATGSYIERLYGRPIALRTLQDHWQQLARRAGIRNEINPHDLRRTAAVRVYTLTKDVLAVKALLGHDALMSTTRYLHPYAPTAMDAAKAALMRWTPKGEPTQ